MKVEVSKPFESKAEQQAEPGTEASQKAKPEADAPTAHEAKVEEGKDAVMQQAELLTEQEGGNIANGVKAETAGEEIPNNPQASETGNAGPEEAGDDEEEPEVSTESDEQRPGKEQQQAESTKPSQPSLEGESEAEPLQQTVQAPAKASDRNGQDGAKPKIEQGEAAEASEPASVQAKVQSLLRSCFAS